MGHWGCRWSRTAAHSESRYACSGRRDADQRPFPRTLAPTSLQWMKLLPRARGTPWACSLIWGGCWCGSPGRIGYAETRAGVSRPEIVWASPPQAFITSSTSRPMAKRGWAPGSIWRPPSLNCKRQTGRERRIRPPGPFSCVRNGSQPSAAAAGCTWVVPGVPGGRSPVPPVGQVGGWQGDRRAGWLVRRTAGCRGIRVTECPAGERRGHRHGPGAFASGPFVLGALPSLAHACVRAPERALSQRRRASRHG